MSVYLTAYNMPKLEHTIEIAASEDKVWEVISDLDHEADYWYGTKSVHNFSKEGNVVEREITQNFRNHRIKQRVVLHPKEAIEIFYLKGLTEGVKKLTIAAQGENKQLLKVYWDAKFTGIYKLFTPWLKGHVDKGTVDALGRIKNVAEGRPIEEEAAATSS